MSLTYSTMLELGTIMPDFKLINTVNNQEFNSDSLSPNKATVVMFICNHCPYVIHCLDQIIDISNHYLGDVEFVAISSNDVENYPDDAPDKMQDLAQKMGFNFPYLYDETQEIAKKFDAQCTPEFYLFNHNNILSYRGRIDDSSPGNGVKSTGKDLRDAIDDLLANKNPSKQQHPSMGCNIKWK